MCRRRRQTPTSSNLMTLFVIPCGVVRCYRVYSNRSVPPPPHRQRFLLQFPHVLLACREPNDYVYRIRITCQHVSYCTYGIARACAIACSINCATYTIYSVYNPMYTADRPPRSISSTKPNKARARQPAKCESIRQASGTERQRTGQRASVCVLHAPREEVRVNFAGITTVRCMCMGEGKCEWAHCGVANIHAHISEASVFPECVGVCVCVLCKCLRAHANTHCAFAHSAHQQHRHPSMFNALTPIRARCASMYGFLARCKRNDDDDDGALCTWYVEIRSNVQTYTHAYTCENALAPCALSVFG